MLRDLRYGLRRLRQSPGFTLIAVLALGLGIGANTAIFSLLDAVVLRPLPYPDPDRMVQVWASLPEQGLDKTEVSVPRFRALRDSGAFASVAAYHDEDVNLTERGDPEYLHAERISREFFDVWGIEPLLGRRFSAAEDQKGGGDVALLSAGFWRRRFGGEPGIVGRAVRLEGKPFTVVGIMPDVLRFPFRQVEVWLPRAQELALIPESAVERGAGFLNLAARLKPGTSLAAVEGELRRLSDRYAQAFPGNLDTAFRFEPVPMGEQLVGDARSSLALLLGAVALVLLIACADVANLLLAQGLSRRKEVAIRMAMGASAGRVVRQMLVEGVVLALLGSAAGLMLAYGGLRLLVAAHPANLPRVDQVGIDPRVLVFTLLLSLLTGVLFSLIPALQSLRTEATAQLKESSRGSTVGPRRARAQGLFVAAEVAVALVLLIGSTLLIQSFRRLSQVDLGFNPAGLLAMQISLPAAKYPDRERQRAFYEQVLERVRALPGVQSAAMSDYLPVQGTARAPFYVEGHPPASPRDQPLGWLMVVSPGFFRTLQTRLVKGQEFDPATPPNAPAAAIVNEAMARQYFPGTDPVGKRLIVGRGKVEIVGVAQDLQQLGPDVEKTPAFFFSNRTGVGALPMPFMHLLVRTSLPPSQVARSVRREVRALDPEQPVADVETMEGIVADAVAGRRMTMGLLSGFSGVALVLCALGIYGLVAHSVSSRRQEIGVRMALGAQRGQVLGVVVRQGFRWVLIGLAVGLVAALLLSRALKGLLFAVGAQDPLYYVGTPILLGLISLLACYLPARRAARVEPGVTLRAEG
ncbi:MAG TPA: ABC transporter permease [Thermoanaerobaculia bacterium]|jgi:putative ABC transport system permease protein